jgi:hypothetical protein
MVDRHDRARVNVDIASRFTSPSRPQSAVQSQIKGPSAGPGHATYDVVLLGVPWRGGESKMM